MSTKKFLLVEHGGNRKQFTLDALRQKDIEVFLACSTHPDWLKDHLDTAHIILTDTYNTIKLLADVATFSELNNLRFDAVGTFFEHTVIQTADLASALNLVGLNPGAARRSSCNKLLMRRTCRDAGIATPRFKVASLLDSKQLEKAINEVGLPCVIKPIFGAESYGTIKVDEGYTLKDVLDEVDLNTTSDKKEVFKNFNGTVLVEEYLPGKVVSVDGIVQRGQISFAGMVEFVMGPEPRFTQEANYIPGRLAPSLVNSCKGMTKDIIQAIGLDNCGFHCELRITPDGPVLLEIAARLPGGPLQLGYKQAYGFDLTSLIVDLWMGEKIKLNPKLNNFVIQKAVFPRSSGVITKISGLDKAQKLKGVWDFAEILKEGDKVTTYPDIPTPFYYYAASAPSERELDELSEKIESNIRIDLDL